MIDTATIAGSRDTRRSIALMSIKPCYWERILDGSKRYELRRRPLRLLRDDLVLVYASAPAKAIVGAFRVRSVLAAPTQELWEREQQRLGIDRGAYFAYFAGVSVAWAIEIRRAVQLNAVPLADLRERLPGFRPPQSFMYWSPNHLISVAPGLDFALNA